MAFPSKVCVPYEIKVIQLEIVLYVIQFNIRDSEAVIHV